MPTRHDTRLYCVAPTDAEDPRKPRLIRATHPRRAGRQGVSRERPILMSAPMVRALLSGAKTQTRRVVKPQPLGGAPTLLEHLLPHQRWATDEAEEEHVWKCPYGEPGDRLWVRETWALDDEDGAMMFRADLGRDVNADDWERGRLDGVPRYRWRPSIHMPRRLSRITLEITGVRVERLQEISEGDAYDEGTAEWCAETQRNGNKWPNIVRAYQGLWESINGRGSWDANPWVWVLEFRTLERQ